MTRYLEVEDVMQVLERMGARTIQIRDGGLMIGALVRPRAQLDGTDVYPSMALKAAALLTSWTTTSPLVANNQRVGWVLTRLFCDGNGAPLVVPEEDAVATVHDTAQGVLTLEALAERLGGWMTPSLMP